MKILKYNLYTEAVCDKGLKMEETCVFMYLFCVAFIYGATYKSNIDTEIVNGRKVVFCKYGKVRMLPRSEFQDYDKCIKCVCDESGLHCETLAGAERITVPKNSACISKLIGCKNYWVMRYDNNIDCPQYLIPKVFSAVGK